MKQLSLTPLELFGWFVQLEMDSKNISYFEQEINRLGMP